MTDSNSVAGCNDFLATDTGTYLLSRIGQWECLTHGTHKCHMCTGREIEALTRSPSGQRDGAG